MRIWQYTQVKALMNKEYTAVTIIFAQAYGADAYSAQQYNGEATVTPIDPTPATPTTPTTTTETAPNTGFLGLSSDGAVASVSGALLLAVALAGVGYIVSSKVRRGRHLKKQGNTNDESA